MKRIYYYDNTFTHKRLYIIGFFLFCGILIINAQGFNLSGLEKTWDTDNPFIYNTLKKDLKSMSAAGIRDIRLPIDLDYYLNQENSSKVKTFKKKINSLVRYASKKEMSLIISNFNHGLDHDNYKQKSTTVAQNWISLLRNLDFQELESKQLYIDIANEPVLYPQEWEESATIIIKAIRNVYPELIILYGSSNYNSIYELSRMNPLPYENIIYSFHFYEPFIFTHQGTQWTGDQNATVGIPFPYPDSTSTAKMPQLSPKSAKTDGAINFRDYKDTGTYQAIRDKITLVKDWQITNKVEVWCTEYGVSKNADKQSRINYLRTVNQVLEDFNIRGYVWEYNGNFGVNKYHNQIF